MIKEEEAYHNRLVAELNDWIADARDQLNRCEREEIDLEPELGEEVIHNTQCNAPRWQEELRNLKVELKLEE